MKYRNIKTGAIIDSSSKIIGEAWIKIEEEDMSTLTKKDIQKLLDDKEVEYNASDTKKELIALLEGD